ncbi:MAG: 16S rRNA (guanine(527)-N(7))-methyltransferase RsmG [Crocinitomicaceae bacterium]|nr:16S rRNA (guanine(527)-N(7))-methyltransferase RsmG [Crocinitomicaceae bacterium]MCH2236101.1 16S rRNA (guanine(527)-N(7))-methyltransferase RsmG [Crocinitomicaceae bacterium]
MAGVELIFEHFPNLTDIQKEQFTKLKDIYVHWNNQINVISRKNYDDFYEQHVLHSLGIAKVISFTPKTAVLDVGTGGGFPGIPLAILFPEVEFYLVDSIGKKIKVVNEVKNALGLTNVIGKQQRAEEIKHHFDFVVSRAVTRMEKFLPWVRNKIKTKGQNGYPNGLFYLKGGDLSEEMAPVREYHEIIDLANFYDGEFFETKKVVYVQLS